MIQLVFFTDPCCSCTKTPGEKVSKMHSWNQTQLQWHVQMLLLLWELWEAFGNNGWQSWTSCLLTIIARSSKIKLHEKCLDAQTAKACFIAKIEEHLAFDSPTCTMKSMSLKTMQVVAGTSIIQCVPSNDKTSAQITNVNRESLTFMIGLTKCGPDKVAVGFDGVTALGENANCVQRVTNCICFVETSVLFCWQHSASKCNVLVCLHSPWWKST